MRQDVQQDEWVRRLLTFWGAWFVVYFFLGALSLSNGETSFFAKTVDRIDQTWVKLIFLNIPLQLILMAVAVACLRAGRTDARRVGLVLATAVSLLIAVHVALSVATAGS